MKGCKGDVAWLSSHHMSDPSPCLRMMMVPICCLITAGEKMSTGDGLGPECPHDSSMILGVEGGQFVEVAFSHPPAF